jgi:AraC family transcriptional regulator
MAHRLSAEFRGGDATLAVEGTWAQGQLYAAAKNWRGADAELVHQRRDHTLVLTLSGHTSLTGTRISDSPTYEGRDAAGCVTFVPAGAERRAWYRDANLDFVVLLIDPNFMSSWALSAELSDLRPFTNRRDPLLEPVLCALAHELRGGGSGLTDLYVEHVAGLVMAHLVRLHQRSNSTRAVQRARLSEARFNQVLERIEEALAREICVAELAEVAGLEPDAFARAFRVRAGVPPHRYVMERRIYHAQRLLEASTRSIAEIALEVGFSSQSHLTTQFRKLRHITPAAFRAQNV